MLDGDALLPRLAGLGRAFVPARAGREDDALLGGRRERRLVFGHTHLPFHRLGPGRASSWSTRAASGCRSTANPRAAYALLHDDGTVEHRRVDYDHEAAAAAVRERFGER